ncbi:MAG: bifunctional aspartate kinase/homoserine dehydrogenase I [Treponema sp.]|jgi:aspartokinase/homoserine dehydrogenase 1|nr:bifunctional aspartate kinase/homoserine dehydrogenase I [Treponema sp.]
MLVLKFGGSSVGSPAAIENIIDILNDSEHRGKVAAVVVSAFSGVTDELIAAARLAAGTAAPEGPATPDSRDRQAPAGSLRRRHRDTAAHFLKGEELEAALAALDRRFGELDRILQGLEVLGELSPGIQDRVMSYGERLSADLLARIFSARGIAASAVDTRPLIKTDSSYGKAAFIPAETYANIRGFFDAARESPVARQAAAQETSAAPAVRPIPVCTGFIGSDSRGHTTTLGRGGSDLSASIIGAALDAEELEIWTDVDGILTADPRLVKNSFRIDLISYVEAMELSHFGAKVIYPPTIRPSLERGIPIRIRNTFNPSSPGTRIVQDAPGGEYPIRGISSMNNIALIRVQGSGMVGVAGFSSRLFGALARRGINIILITQSSSEYSICFAVLPQDAPGALAAIQDEFGREIAAGTIENPVSEDELSIIAVVGAGMKRSSGIAGKVFHALGRNGVNVVAIAQGSSELNISAVVARQDEAKALNAIHEAFFLSTVRSVNLFLLGLGLIGGTLIDQITRQKEILAAEHKIRINVVGAANSSRMLFNSAGLETGELRSLPGAEDRGPRNGFPGPGSKPSPEPYSLPAFIDRMKAMNLPNTAFCDCTASDEVSAAYGDIIRCAIPIVTPNKRANSGALAYYRELTEYSRERGIPYLYETTVCAGLPVISTLRDLHLSGDRVHRIEAVLSGTLSFVFNNFDGTATFSALLREARARGYTEPDPRDDLNAMDAARKALILARECGMALEFSAVDIEPILPPACFDAKDVESFFTELEKSDEAFEKRRKEAESRGEALRYVAVIEEGSARLSLRAEPEGSPFRSLVDADNVVVITTSRYSKLPMVIKGPGAGAQVTAGGIFADIVRIARTLV